MSLQNFRSMLTRKFKKPADTSEVINNSESSLSAAAALDSAKTPNIRQATIARKNAITVSCVFFTLSVIFLILTIIGNTSKKAIIRSTYFVRLDLANIIPASTPGDIVLVNSLARSLGLHDFYQVGIWNFCEGYNNEGVTFCSPPKSRYWFNPVEILLDELLAGATIALPADINNILKMVKLASNILFCFFLAGISMNVVSIFVAPITLRSRWWSLPFALWSFFAALFTTVACLIVTAMSLIFVKVATSQPGLNISASIGKSFFAFMWIGSIFSILGLLMHLSLICCCASRRDITTGRVKVITTDISNEKRFLPKVREWAESLPVPLKKSPPEVV
ncbi:hypothetical protein K3495_g6993 [Podosphaera aphanis]|nr:hypothetical protein K3495_g6993 [Podosphaera aphanis]